MNPTPPRKTKLYHDESFAVDGPRAFSMTNNSEWTEGHVVTSHHMVSVYSQHGHSRMDTVHGGRHHMRTFDHRLTATGLARAAGKWSRELAELPKAAGRGRKS